MKGSGLLKIDSERCPAVHVCATERQNPEQHEPLTVSQIDQNSDSNSIALGEKRSTCVLWQSNGSEFNFGFRKILFLSTIKRPEAVHIKIN